MNASIWILEDQLRRPNFKDREDDTEKIQRIRAAHSLASIRLIPLPDGAEPEVDLTEHLIQLQALLTDYDAGDAGLAAFLPVLQEIGLSNLTCDHIRPLCDLLPDGPLEEQQDAFKLLDFLMGDDGLAQDIVEWGFLQSLDYSTLPALADLPFQGVICSVILSAVERVPGSPEGLADQFMEPFIGFICGSIETIWGCEGRLGDLLSLLEVFVPLVHDVDILGHLLDRVCTLFVHHPAVSIGQSALETSARIVSDHPELAQSDQFGQATFFQRLEFLGGQRDHPELVQAVITLWTLLLTKRDDRLPISHQPAADLLVSELAGDAHSPLRGPMMSLLLVVVAIPGFVADFGDQICHCIDGVLQGYSTFRVREKCELGRLLANVFAFLDVGVANALLESDVGIDVVVEIMELNDPEVARILLCGLYKAISSADSVIRKFEGRRAQLIEAVQGIRTRCEADDDKLYRTAEVIMGALQR
jgi:hypothetical protein